MLLFITAFWFDGAACAGMTFSLSEAQDAFDFFRQVLMIGLPTRGGVGRLHAPYLPLRKAKACFLVELFKHLVQLHSLFHRRGPVRLV